MYVTVSKILCRKGELYMNKEMKITDYITSFLVAQGVTHVFEVIGGMTTHLVDSIYRDGKIRIICTHHEQAAVFAAEAMARISGIPGIAMATSGPGATNLLTGIGSCYFDSSPAIFFTGQVNRDEQKGNRATRQLGFQETDIVRMAAPITKAAWCIQKPEEIPDLLINAFDLAVSGRPGPVLIDIPMDVQRSMIEVREPSKVSVNFSEDIAKGTTEELIQSLYEAKRPLVLVGNGVRLSKSTDLFRQFIAKVKIPVVNSLMAVDTLSSEDIFRVGMIGTYGNRWANIALGRSDLLLVLGSRLDIRQTGSDVDSFKSDRIIYHVDCDMAELNNRVKGCRAINADLNVFLSTILHMSKKYTFPYREEWISEIKEYKTKWPDTDELNKGKGINPNVFMHQLSATSGLAAAYITDVGQHQMWAAQSIDLLPHQRYLTSGGMGAMGFALPAAIGASLSCSEQPVVMIAGDGGFQINIQELETLAHNHLPVKMIILNNQCYGMVRQFQQSYFNKRYQSTCWGYSTPDFVQIAQAYGIQACTVENPADVQDKLKQLWRDPQSPFLLQVAIDTSYNAYPKIAFGCPMTEMEPLAEPLDMEGT